MTSLSIPAPSSETARPRYRAGAKRRRGTLIVVAIGVIVASVAGYLALEPTPVPVSRVIRGTAVEAVYATGTVEPFNRVIVKAKAAGAIDLRVREGAVVRKGDVLATIDSPTLRYDLARGKADLWAASKQAASNGPQLMALDAQTRSLTADLATVRSDRARSERLVATGATPQAELDRLIDREHSLVAQLDAVDAQRRSLKIDLDARASGTSATVESLASRVADSEVRSPIDGVVLTRFVEPGEVAVVNAPIVKVGDIDNLVLECSVDEADIAKVTLGKKVAISLYAFSSVALAGEVFEILPDADRVKKAFTAKVRFQAPPPGLRSGMTGEANIVVEEHPGALLLSAEAVDANGSVFLVERGRLARRSPEIGVRDLVRIEVLGGLSEGDEVVVGPSSGLREGARVRTTRKDSFESTVRTSAPRSKMSL